MNGTDIIDLGFPVSLEYGNVIEFEYHIRMLFKRLFSGIFVVLGSYADNNSTLFELLYPHLELGERFANTQSMTKLDALQTVISNYSTPNGVVEVKDQAFLELPFHGTNNVHYSGCYIRQCIHGENHLCAGIDVGCKHNVTAKFVLKSCNITDEEVLILL